MVENIAYRAEKYIRRNDTVLAKAAQAISLESGLDYRSGSTKKLVDKSLAVTIGLIAMPIIASTAIAAKIEDGGSCFYRQQRVGKNDQPITVTKIRSMKMRADEDLDGTINNISRYGVNNDPRNTRLGKRIRKLGIDELPQLANVISGSMSLVGIRAHMNEIHQTMARLRPQTYQEWHAAYIASEPGLFNITTALNPRNRNHSARYHLDMFYARKASLGFDFYLLARTFISPFIKRR